MNGCLGLPPKNAYTRFSLSHPSQLFIFTRLKIPTKLYVFVEKTERYPYIPWLNLKTLENELRKTMYQWVYVSSFCFPMSEIIFVKQEEIIEIVPFVLAIHALVTFFRILSLSFPDIIIIIIIEIIIFLLRLSSSVCFLPNSKTCNH